MSALALIIGLSTVVYYIIDKLKQYWIEKPYGKYITILAAAIGSFGITFGYNLDFIHATGLVTESTLAGQILTGFVLMSSSSAVSEILERIQGVKQVGSGEESELLEE